MQALEQRWGLPSRHNHIECKSGWFPLIENFLAELFVFGVELNSLVFKGQA